MKELKNGSVKFDLSEVNDLAVLAGEAAEHYKALGYPALERSAREMRDALYKICDAHGLYKDC